ncbi:MAG: radical SAM protein [Armatimonadetes bacterium]|nr:radical SAM protein [Armatimonadota bacterium]
MRYRGNVIRPPSEAGSYILQVAWGCSHNRCTFCGTYGDLTFQIRPLEEVREDILMAKSYYGDLRRVFLADGNALVLPTERLLGILGCLKEAFPSLQRVGIYARATDILRKSAEELRDLRAAGLGIVYVGLESGSDSVLSLVRKGCTRDEAVAGCIRAKEADLKLSTIILLGIGGKSLSREHSLESARLVNAINPRYLSLLTLMILKNTPLYEKVQQGLFELPDPGGLLEEMKLFIENLDVRQTIFRTNHASNYLSLEGTLGKDRDRILREIDRALQAGFLRPEFIRGL